MQEEVIAPGEFLWKNQEYSDYSTAFYIILKGKINIFVGKTKISVLKEKDYFGEIGFFTNSPHYFQA